jgi:hypothetical protein
VNIVRPVAGALRAIASMQFTNLLEDNLIRNLIGGDHETSRLQTLVVAEPQIA